MVAENVYVKWCLQQSSGSKKTHIKTLSKFTPDVAAIKVLNFLCRWNKMRILRTVQKIYAEQACGQFFDELKLDNEVKIDGVNDLWVDQYKYKSNLRHCNLPRMYVYRTLEYLKVFSLFLNRRRGFSKHAWRFEKALLEVSVPQRTGAFQKYEKWKNLKTRTPKLHCTERC